MDYAYIKQRITDLRIDKGVSEYQMSLDLGHSRSYMQNISSGRSKLLLHSNRQRIWKTVCKESKIN